MPTSPADGGGGRPLTVFVPIHSFEPGGVERIALRLCGVWAASALDVRIVLGRDAGAMRGKAPAGVPWLLTPEPIPTARWETLWMIWVLWQQVRRDPPDVIFAAGNTYAIVAGAMKLLLGRRCPPVVMKVSNDLVRSDLPAIARPFYRLWTRWQGRFIDTLVGIAEPMRDEIAAAMRVPPGDVAIVDDPALDPGVAARLEQAALARRPLAKGRRYATVARLAAQKNLPLMIDAFAEAARPGDTLTITGEGGERARLERQIKRLHLQDRVRLPGHGDAVAALADADVFLLSSDYEAVPAVVIEALAAGLPVVATDCSVSMRALVGQFGQVVPVRDVAALAAAMVAQAPLSPAEQAAGRASLARFTLAEAAPAYARLFRAAADRCGAVTFTRA